LRTAYDDSVQKAQAKPQPLQFLLLTVGRLGRALESVSCLFASLVGGTASVVRRSLVSQKKAHRVGNPISWDAVGVASIRSKPVLPACCGLALRMGLGCDGLGHERRDEIRPKNRPPGVRRCATPLLACSLKAGRSVQNLKELR
jgi:hypothetical protein